MSQVAGIKRKALPRRRSSTSSSDGSSSEENESINGENSTVVRIPFIAEKALSSKAFRARCKDVPWPPSTKSFIVYSDAEEVKVEWMGDYEAKDKSFRIRCCT
jgi:hypothetical protein